MSHNDEGDVDDYNDASGTYLLLVVDGHKETLPLS